jgi:2-hydroxyacyl-CoA lyase 1
MRSWSLGFETKYEMFADAVGGKGYLVRTSEELRRAVEEGFKAEVPVMVNVLTETGKGFPATFGFEVTPPSGEAKPNPESKL